MCAWCTYTVMHFYSNTINPPLTLLSPSPLPHRSFMQVCQEALDLNGHLISTDQLMYQDELRNKFQQMQATLTPLLQAEEKVCSVSVSLFVCVSVHAMCAVHLCTRSVCTQHNWYGIPDCAKFLRVFNFTNFANFPPFTKITE